MGVGGGGGNQESMNWRCVVLWARVDELLDLDSTADAASLSSGVAAHPSHAQRFRRLRAKSCLRAGREPVASSRIAARSRCFSAFASSFRMVSQKLAYSICRDELAGNFSSSSSYIY